MVVLEQEIERRVVPFEEPIARLMTIPGIDRKTAWMIVAEIGVDMSVFGDAKHLASWVGLVSRQSRERRQADERTNAQGESLCAARDVPGGLGRHAHQEHVSDAPFIAVSRCAKARRKRSWRWPIT